ncbi:MAG TPA: amidohydrolase family protein [Bryobacteraceae bacterium]|jgi:imidazolonepropionase-like amidohydrolase|nr:amidohydrolase family protein [Bryobacteraceae bacterium]
MRTLACLFIASVCYGQVVYENARLITGDGRPPIENGAFAVRNGRITAIGRKGSVRGTSHVDLSGKTVIPAMINSHLHIGYEGYTSWGAENYTPQNVLDHLQREAFYGVGATQTVGSSPADSSIQFIREQTAGKFTPASRFFFMPGMAPPNGGPDAILRKGTSALHAVYEVTTGPEARAAVQGMAAKGLKSVKIWVDDRRGTYPKMTPEVYNAVIDEAHRHRMIVQAHAIALEDQKAVVRAGADVLVHIVANEKIDDELQALIREKKPYWTPVMGLGDRSEVCDSDPFIDQVLPTETVKSIQATGCGPLTANARTREEMLAYNFPRMIAAGARLVLGTDAGISNRYSFGWADHHELARYVQFGLTPAQAIIAATQRPAAMIGIGDMGTLAAGKSADFVVLNANPLDNIRNTRSIESVYLRGVRLDREGLLKKWQTAR